MQRLIVVIIDVGSLGNWWNGYIEDVRISSNVRYKGTSSTEWDNYLYDGVSRWDIPIISHVTGISRILIGTNDGVGISGNLGFSGGTSGDITFNNSLQTGVQVYTASELATLLGTEYLKHSSVDTLEDHLLGTSIDTDSIVNVVNSSGNKYVFNNSSSYDSSEKWTLKNGTYIFKNISINHPLAILNNGNSIIIILLMMIPQL